MHGPRRAGAENLRARPDRGFSRPGPWALLFAWLALAEAGVSHAQTAPGTPIPNTAQATFVPPGGGVATVFSNTDVIITVGARSPSVTEFFHFAPGNPGAFPTAVGAETCSSSGTAAGPFVPAPPPTDLSGAPINLAAPVDLATSGPFHRGEVVFVRISDPDQNRNAATAETLLVTLRSLSTGDQEVLRLAETGPNTGLFVGYLMSAAPPPLAGDCRLSVSLGEQIRVDYVDAVDGTDSSSDTEVVDPFGFVFDSATGAPLDGASITLTDDATGLPASVLGDDGVSTFPQTILSGGTTSDSGGTVYTFAPGQFRFPWVVAGAYRLVVVPPSGYAFPSAVPDAALQTLPGAPFALGPGSRGTAFAVPVGPAFQVDVPLDGTGGGAGLSLTKVASRSSVGTGEFVQYRLTVRAPAFAVPDLTVQDRLPVGFRFAPGSLAIDGVRAPDPVVSADGRGLAITIGAVAASALVDVRYVAQVGADAKAGLALNQAIAAGAGLASNVAQATVLVLSDFFTERAFLVGRVMIGACDSPVVETHPGAAGVRVFLEDGSQVVTDAEGRFHFAAVSADTHVVQLDLDTLPAGLAPLPCPGTRFAGSPLSQFVELQPGTLWRADFFLAPVATGRPRLAQRLRLERRGDVTAVELRLTSENASVDGAAATVVLPEGARLVPGSLRLEGEGVRAEETEGAATLRVPSLAATQTAALRFDLAGASPGAEVRSLVRAKGPGGVPVQTPVARVELCEGCASAFVDEGLALPDEPPPPAAEPEAPAPPEERYGEAWLATAAPGARWLYPEPGAVPKIPSTKIGIALSAAHRVRLTRNGEPVEPLNYDGRVRNAARGTAIDRWRGVDLAEGPNLFVAEIVDESGSPVERIEARVHFSGSPVRAELEPAESLLVADGRTTPVVALRLYDRWGEPVREGVTGPLRIAPPHQTREELDALHRRPLAGMTPFAPAWVVGRNGIAKVELAPTAVVGQLRLSLALAGDRTQEFETWLEPGEREWVLVALGTSTLGVAGFSGSDEVRKTGDLEDGSFSEGRFAFFAKGSVLGKWLLTAAYDTEAERTRLDERLFRTLDPDEHYTLYGDTTEQSSDAPTSERLYLKVERSRFFALYGDYQTGLDQSELSRYTRSLHGVQTQYFGEQLRWNAFATDSGKGFIRDEIPGNGTSGLYRLTNSGLVANSERVSIEVRDRFRASRVIESRALTRHADYDVDYNSGTLHFREAIPGRDTLFNPVFIVADYEVEQAEDAVTGGGRMAGRFLGGALELGATGLHEGRGDLAGQLFGADAKLELGDQTLRAEFAHSADERLGGMARGEGWLVAADHRSERLDLTAYAREQDGTFGFGQQSAIDAGARRIGVDASVRLDDQWKVENSAFREQNLDTNDERTLGESVLVYETSGAGAHLGGRYVRDGAAGAPSVPALPDEATNVWQLLAGGHYDVWDNRVTLRAATELGFGTEDSHGDYGDRVLVGADWRVLDKLTVFGEQEFGLGERATRDTRAGIRLEPWQGASLSSSFGHEAREWGPRTFANLGLAQHWNATPHWAFDFLVDRSQTLSGEDVVPFDAGAFPVSGSLTDDYTAVSMGAAFQRDATAWTTRLESRFGDVEDQQNVLVGLLRDHERTSWSGRLEAFRTQSDGPGGARENRLAARFGVAHRPLDPRFVLLEQVDLELEARDGQGFDFEARRALHHLKLNHLWNRRTQIAWGWSSKWVTDTIDEQGYATFGNLGQVELRRDLGDLWDVGLHLRGRHLTGESGDGLDFSTGVSVGRKLYQNIWVSVGYNVTGFHDEEFSRSEYTQAGFYFRVRVKVDQQSLADILGWPPQTREPAER